MRYLVLVVLTLLGCTQSDFTAHVETSALGALAPQPLFRDPVYDGAADPSIVYNRVEHNWWMFYTNRRANVPGLSEVSWVHGTPIGVAVSEDGAHWHYRGTVDFPRDIPYTDLPAPTYWAPAVLEHQGTYHMYLTIVPGVFEDWNHPRRIVHLTSTDLLQWHYQSTLPLVNEKVIDATVFPLPDGTWRLWYNNELDGKKTYYADSPDLYQWQDRGSAHLPNDRGEAPMVFHWQGYYWLLNDLLGSNGLGVYRSEDALNWVRQSNDLLNVPGTGADDQGAGQHPHVIVSGERAFLYYFVHPERFAAAAGDAGADTKRSSLQVVELQFVAGWLRAERNAPTWVRLLPPSSD